MSRDFHFGLPDQHSSIYEPIFCTRGFRRRRFFQLPSPNGAIFHGAPFWRGHCSAARQSWGPSRGHPWLLGGSEGPWLSVLVFRRVWRYRCNSTLRSCADCATSQGDLPPTSRPGLAKSECPLGVAISTGRCNTFVKFLCWRVKTKCFTWSVVKLTSHFVQMSLRVYRQIGAHHCLIELLP